MGRHVLPRKDAEFCSWTQFFAAGLTRDPEAYGASAESAEAYGVLQRAFEVALTRAVEPMTRGPRNVFLKDEARRLLEAETRRLARTARTVADADALQAVGLPPSAERRSLVRAPGASPIVRARLDGNAVRVRVTPRTGSPKRRPGDAIGAMIFLFHGETPPSRPSDWRAAATTTKLQVTLWPDAWQSAEGSATCLWVAACWLGPRLDWSPTSDPVSAGLPRLRLAA